MKRNGIVLLAVVMLLAAGNVVAGGKIEQKSDKKSPAIQTDPGADIFANETDGILGVINQTGIDIVLFAGDVRRNIVLGGIRASSFRIFDISKIENIPEKGAFIIRGVPANLYQQKNDRLTESDVLYTGLVVFDLKDTDKIEKLIPGEIDETMSFSIYASNDSRTVCELRLNTPDGPAIAVFSPFQQNKAIWIKPSGFGQPYIIWPIFFSVDPDGTIHEVSSADTRGSRVIPEPPGGGIWPLQFKNPADGDEQINLLFE